MAIRNQKSLFLLPVFEPGFGRCGSEAMRFVVSLLERVELHDDGSGVQQTTDVRETASVEATPSSSLMDVDSESVAVPRTPARNVANRLSPREHLLQWLSKGLCASSVDDELTRESPLAAAVDSMPEPRLWARTFALLCQSGIPSYVLLLIFILFL